MAVPCLAAITKKMVIFLRDIRSRRHAVHSYTPLTGFESRRVALGVKITTAAAVYLARTTASAMTLTRATAES